MAAKMKDESLIWNETSRKNVFKTPVFSVSEIQCTAPAASGDGKAEGEKAEGGKPGTGTFSVIESRDWAMVVPVLEAGTGKSFIMVRQWRHGARAVSVEFPGGVIEDSETPLEGVKRELLEETGFSAKKWRKLSSMSPNPAIMSNTVHFFLAEELSREGGQKLDKDEFVEIEVHSQEDLLKNIGKPPYIHSLTAAALCHYLINKD